MGVGSTRTQKAKVLQLQVDGFADHRCGAPDRLHVVVIPSLTPIDARNMVTFEDLPNRTPASSAAVAEAAPAGEGDQP